MSNLFKLVWPNVTFGYQAILRAEPIFQRYTASNHMKNKRKNNFLWGRCYRWFKSM